MTLKHFYSWKVQSRLREHRALTRDAVMGIGAESYTGLAIPNRRVPKVPKNTTIEKNSKTKRHGIQMSPSTHEEDDNESEVVVVSSGIIRKRKTSIASTPGPRSKRARVTRALSDEPKLSDSELEEETSRDESEYDYGEVFDPENEQKTAQASKNFDSACRSCRINANKALKTKYELQISKLRCEHKQELRRVKAEKTETLAETKTKASEEKAKAKAKYEKHIKELKNHRDEKLEAWKDKHKEAVEEWQERFDEDKRKIKKLTGQRDTADSERKETEKSAADIVKAAEEDLKAGERKFREERKQMLREMQQQIDILKPEHSKALKDKDKIIKDLTQNVLQREKDVQSRDHTLQRVEASHEVLQQRFQHLKTEHTDNQKHTKEVEKNLHESQKYAAGVDGRTDGKLARAQEKIDLQEANVREHANRVITLQRENYNLKDTVNQLARLGREKRDEVERLKADLQSTKAELGVVKDMEEMSGGFE
ncbi:hypothetical protein MBLNU13_g05979t1 [Cladosporium sp. NU13]